ncbi:MAG: hypothetical protein WAO19_15160 [Candidatus Kryptoniota bacterium]
MKRAVAIFAITILITSAAFPQVHIKENATIAPRQAKKVQDGTQMISMNFVWPYCENLGPGTARVKVVDPCNDTTTYSSMTDPFTVEIDNPIAGVYTFSLSLSPAANPNGVPCGAGIFGGICASISWDGSLFLAVGCDNLIVDPSDPNWNLVLWQNNWFKGFSGIFAGVNVSETGDGTGIIFETPYSSGFSLRFSGCMFYEQTAQINLVNTYDCSTNEWYPYSPITLRIISGSQYASFHTFDSEAGEDVKLDSVVNVGTADSVGDIGPYYNGGYYYLVADGVQPDSGGDWVVVQAESDGMTSIDSLQDFWPVGVTFTPPKISPGDTATIVVNERNADGTISDFPPGQLFEVGIDSGNAYGTILSSGDTAEYFASIPEPFQFIAADSINVDSVEAAVRVGEITAIACSTTPGGKSVKKSVKATVSAVNTTVDKHAKSYLANESAKKKNVATIGARKVSGYNFTTSLYGIGEMEVKKPSLKIVNHAPWSIWPDLPTGAITSKETNPPGYNHKRGFTILVTDADGKPIQNAAVEIIHDYQQGTGGHAHDTSHDYIPLQSLQGTFYGQDDSGDSLELTTDANGKAVVDSLVASQISGTYLITAYLASDPTIMDTVNLNVQVLGLLPFNEMYPKGEKPFILVQSDTGKGNHPDNDYCTPLMGDSLFAGILDFYSWSMSDSAGNGGVPIILSINDMSLPWGGAFDIKGTWNVNTFHTYHRVGLSVDFNRNGMPDYVVDQLTIFMHDYHGDRNPEEPIHYGFFNGGN